jgi:GT2 family glycosyltransferase
MAGAFRLLTGTKGDQVAGDDTISVIVCAHSYERREFLRSAIESLHAQVHAARELILVVDYNPPLAEWARDTLSGVTVIDNSGKRGLSGARNAGVARASGSVIAFLDDDARARPDWLSRMRSHYDDSIVIGVGGRVAPVWPKERPEWFPREFDWVVGCSYRGQPEGVAAVRNLIGCNMSFRREVFERIGGFNEGLGREGGNAAGCEETELCIRAAEAFPRSRFVHDPEVAVFHHVSLARVNWTYFRERCRAEGRSKALMTRKVGEGTGLSSEARYATRVLPAAVLRSVADAIFRFDVMGLARAGAVICGFAHVAGSYARTRHLERRRKGAFAPLRICDVDISKPLAKIAFRGAEGGAKYGGAYCLVRDSGRPVAVVEVPLADEDLQAEELSKSITEALGHPAGQTVQLCPEGLAPFASVVIATRDRPASLAACLDSLLRQDYEPFEIIVVDNAPATSDTADLVARRYSETGKVRYLREDRPGLGRAHNCGLRLAKAAIIAFTDDDVIVDPGWLKAIASEFQSSDRIGCVTGLILPAELETRAQYWTERHGGFGKGFERRVFDLGENRLEGKLFPFAAGAFGSGANMAFSRRALERIGGFDCALGAGTPARGGDDLASFVAVVRGGLQLVYQPEAIVWHHHRRAEEGMRRQAYDYGVGLGAYLTKLVVDEPALALHFAKASPAAIAYILGSSSDKNRRVPDDYPRSFVWRERIGILAGIPAYLRSRASARRNDGPIAPVGLAPAGPGKQEVS